MDRVHCPNCICSGGYQSITRGPFPSLPAIKQMSLERFLRVLDGMNIYFNPDGTQKIVLYGDLRDICQYVRGAIRKRLQENRQTIQQMIYESIEC